MLNQKSESWGFLKVRKCDVKRCWYFSTTAITSKFQWVHSRGGCFVDSITTPVWLCFFWTKAFNQCHRASPLHLLIQAQIDPTPEFLQLKLLLLFLSTDSVWETGKVYKVKRQNFNCTFVKKSLTPSGEKSLRKIKWYDEEQDIF